MNKLTEWVKSHKPHTAGIIVAIVAVIALSVAVATGVFSNKTADTASNEPTVTAEVPVNTKKTPVTINVTADDKVTKDSTPTIVHVQSTDERKEAVDFYHAVDSGKKTDTVEVSPGDYKVTVTGVINKDGSVTKPVAQSKEINVSIKSTDKSKDAENKATVNVEFDKTIPADKVTEKDVKEITDATKTAIENRDDSLKGDAGKAILGKVEANTKANTHLSDDAKATVAESTDKAQASTETEAKTTVTEAPKSASKPTERGKTWVPEKGHWEKTTKKVWVPNVVTVQDSEEQTVLVETTTVFWYGSHKWETETIKKNISTGKYIQSGTNLLGRWCRSEDGQIYPLRRNYDHLMAEFPEVILSEDENGHAMEVSDHWIRTGYETIPGQSHTEDRGHYETKVTGKRWVVDQAGHYE